MLLYQVEVRRIHVKDAFYAFLARLLSFDDIRRVLTSIFARTSVSQVVASSAEGRFMLDPRDRLKCLRCGASIFSSHRF